MLCLTAEYPSVPTGAEEPELCGEWESSSPASLHFICYLSNNIIWMKRFRTRMSTIYILERAINPCYEGACSYFGQCNEVNQGYSCSCPVQFTGTYCHEASKSDGNSFNSGDNTAMKPVSLTEIYSTHGLLTNFYWLNWIL